MLQNAVSSHCLSVADLLGYDVFGSYIYCAIGQRAQASLGPIYTSKRPESHIYQP